MSEQYNPNIQVQQEDTTVKRNTDISPVDETIKENNDERPLGVLSKPHILSVIDVGKWLEDNIDNSQSKVEFVDRAIKHNIDKLEWQQTTKSYNDIISLLKNTLDINDNHDNLTKLDKIYMYFKLGLSI